MSARAEVLEWMDKAEADFEAAKDLAKRRRKPLPDQVCFLCQQSAEKYLKAFLIAQELEPPRTHNLSQLVDICAGRDASFERIREFAASLNPYAVGYRYPGWSATVEEAKEAAQNARKVRAFVRRRLGGKEVGAQE